MPRRRRLKVGWADGATRDLDGIADYVASESPGSAGALRKEIIDAASQLADNPARGRVVPELRDLGVDQLRELIVSPYRVIYSLEGGRVTVLMVVDGRRNFDDLLLVWLIEQNLA